MSSLFSEAGNPVRLGSRLGRGGEAQVFIIEGNPKDVAKVYHAALDAEHCVKLEWMIAHPPVDPGMPQHVSFAWPREFLKDGSGAFTGIVLPRVPDSRPLIQIYNPSQRMKVAPTWTAKHLYRTATNLASVVAALHAADYVIGDLNESNVLVTPDARVSVIDTDSFQVRKKLFGGGEHIFRCKVGKPEFTAPELQGKSLQSVVRTPQQDAFGLGVLVFLLLMEGNHPFRHRWTGTVAPPSLEDSISKGYFPYQPTNAPIQPPPHVVGLKSLSPGLQALFRRCFVDGRVNPANRPTAEEWKSELVLAERHLMSCSNGHYYSDSNSECPACKLNVFHQTSQQVQRRSGSTSRSATSGQAVVFSGWTPPQSSSNVSTPVSPPISGPITSVTTGSAVGSSPVAKKKSRRGWLLSLLAFGAWRWIASRNQGSQGDTSGLAPTVTPDDSNLPDGGASESASKLLVVPTVLSFGTLGTGLISDNANLRIVEKLDRTSLTNANREAMYYYEWRFNNPRGRDYEVSATISGAKGLGAFGVILESTPASSVKVMVDSVNSEWFVAKQSIIGGAENWEILQRIALPKGRSVRTVNVRASYGKVSVSINGASFSNEVATSGRAVHGQVSIGFGLENYGTDIGDEFTVELERFSVLWVSSA